MASLHLVIIFCSFALFQTTILPNLVGDVLLTRLESPYDAPGDAIIPFGSTVTVESGTTVRFPRGSQLIVRGTLLAKGTPDRRIIFTSSTSALYQDQQQIHRTSGANIRFRLVDGSSVQNGLLQMYFKNRWRYVCTEFYRWFDYDATLTCRMMGFRNGSVIPYRINGSEPPWYGLQIDHPACRPFVDEHVLDCPGVSVPPRLGLHICDDKQYVRLQCDGFFDPLTVLNWGGIVFERKFSTNKLTDIPEISDAASPLYNDLNQRPSILNYVDILHAGLRPELTIRSYAERFAALTVFDNLVNPLFDNITVLYSASDGMNFSNVGSSVKLKNSVSAYNRGHGITVTSRYGNVTLDNVHVYDNGGDGVYYAMNNTEWSEREQEESPKRLYKSFCETANTVEFPSYFTYRPPAAGTCCTQAFSSMYNTRLTVHFQSVFLGDYRTRYRIELYNGLFDMMPLLANVTFNRTIESLSSSSNELLVRLCHSCDDVRSLSCWNQSDRIELYVVNDDGRDADMHIWNSRIVNNSLNGVRVVNLRSLIEINQTIINHNQRHGLDIDSGAGALWTYHSKFNSNGEDGIHMIYDGGERRIFYSDISFNHQHGLSVRPDSAPTGFLLSSLTFPTFACRQLTFVNGSSIRSNGFYGLWHRATCHPSLFYVNGSLFERSVYDAIRFDSCQHEWRPQKVIDYQFRSPLVPLNSLLPPPPPPSIIYQAPLNIYPDYPPWIPVALLYANETGNTVMNITWNRFLNNKRVGLRFNPIQNVLGDIANNSFIGHENGALLIVGNQSNWIEDVYLRNVTLRILFNNFTNNFGKNFIVSLDLNELSPYQTILFMYNRLINNNVTSKISQFLNGRSRMPGVLTIGSSHIRITRNVFGNNQSQYEIVSQLTNSSATIKADMNFFTSIYPPPSTLTRIPLSPYERNQHMQNAVHNYRLYQRQEIPLRHMSPIHRILHNRTRRQQQMEVQPVPQISYTYLTEPYDLRTDFFPQDSVFQRPYAPPQTVQYYPPEGQQEILSVPSINKSALLSSINNDWSYYASPASPTPYYFSLYYDRPELCFSQWPKIRERIFDQHNRSNLAMIVWYPFLCSDRNLTTEIWRCQLPNCGFESTSFRIDPLASTIGGIIDMDYSLSPGRYIVTNDILIKPDKRLLIQSSQLEFLNGVGMFVYGELMIQGVDGSPTRFGLYENRTSTSILVNQQKQQEQSQRNIMLIDGTSIYEGRLFVTSLNDGSGTVCNHGWTKENSMLVCMSLGFIHDPNEYLYPIINPNQTVTNDPIIWSEVDCDLYQDQTLERCRKETVHTCDHSDDVWIKCLPSSWAGVHIYPTYSKTHMEFVQFDSAGQFDVHRDEIHAALHIDLLSHPSNRLKNLTFTDNVIGLQINHIHPANYDHSIIRHSTFNHNYLAGLLLRSSFLNVSHCTFTNHLHSGMTFDASYPYHELEQLRINLLRPRTSVHTIDLLYEQSYELERNKFAFITTSFGGYNADDNLLLNTLNIRTDPSFILVIDLIDYNPLSNLNEQILICEVECYQRMGLMQSLSYKKWSLANDRDLFPLVTSYSSLQLHYRLYKYRSSRLTFIIYSIPAPIFTQGKFLSDISIRFHRCLFSMNQHDILSNLNDREKTNNQYALTNQLKTDTERLIEQLLMGPQLTNDDPSLDVIIEEHQKIREEFRDEKLEDERLKRRTTMIDVKRRYKNSTLQINECLFELNQNRSILINHQSIKHSARKTEENIRMLMNETIQQRKQFIPIQFTCRIHKSIFMNNKQVLNLDAHPLIYSDRLVRFEITQTNFTHNHDLLLNLTFPRLYPFNRTSFASLSIWPYFPTRSIYTRSPLIYSIPSHAVRIYKNVFIANEDCSIRLTGFHASFNLTHSLFENNLNYRTSLVDLRHTEKDFLLDGNIFLRNQVHNLLSFDFNGHAPFHNDLLYQSSIIFNQFVDNKPSLLTKYPYLPSSCLRLVGSHNATVQRNLFENVHYDYELIAALVIDTINTTLDATVNWWGSDVGQAIQNRILDFTKRSDHAYAQWNPFLACRELTCAQIKLPLQTMLQLNRPLRGLISTNTLIHRRREPYLINGDLIVMPGVKLTIEPGVELHFAPNTGLLVLGHLNATGTPKDPIVMKLANKQFVMEQIQNGHNPFQYHFTDEVPFSKHKFNPFVDRLQIRLDIGRTPNEGFLQIYNFTRRDWSYVCYDTFRQLSSYRLLCHQLGLPWKNTLAHPDSFYLFDYQKLPLWQEKIDCSGNEPSISSCSFTNEYNSSCTKLFYLSCYDDNVFYSLNSKFQPELGINLGGHVSPDSSPTYESPQSWNGIRFANSEYEEDLSSLDYMIRDQSLLRYVLISETNEYQPAIQTIYRTPAIERIHIEHSRQIGFEFLVPKQSVLFGYSQITNSLDLAVNGLVYYGQSTDEKSTFELLNEQNIHGQPFSLLNLCNAHRIVNVKYRLITYFKYDYEYRTCSKLFCSNNPYQIGIRFFQANLLNSTYQNDWIEIHRVNNDQDGNERNELLTSLTNGSSETAWRNLYSIEKGCLRVTIHASSGSKIDGFMAEVTLFPVTPFSTQEVVHQISSNVFLGNQQGVLRYTSAGERSANVYFQSNTLLYNGYYRFNSSSAPINFFHFQNAQRFYFGNNWLSRNLGGTYIQCHSQSLSSIFNGHLFNNVFFRNNNDSVLTFYGMEMSAFCNLFAIQNAMMFNDAYDRNLIEFDSVVANFSRNQVFNNTGMNILSMVGFEKITAPFPAVEMNAFRNNRAVGKLNQQLFDRTGAVVEVGNPRQIYMFNTFDNWDSRYEMRTKSRLYEPNRMESRAVNASLNFWGRIGDVDDIGARIYDKFDNKSLIEVNFYPPYLESTRLRQGKCDPGWTLDDNMCYIYLGAITTYRIAQEMCSSIDARITRRDVPLNRLVILRSLARTSQYQGINSDAVPPSGIWLRKDYNQDCRVFNDMQTMDASCSSTAGFICEKEQQFDGAKYIIRGDLLLAIGGLILMILFIIIFICCWLCKSRQRKKDNFHRQNSLRRSVKQEMSKQSTLSLHKSNDNTLVKSATLSTLTNGTTNKLPLSTLSLSSRPLSSVTMNSDQDLSTSSPAHQDFSLLKLNHHIPKASTPALSDDAGSQRALVLNTHTDQSSVYSTATADSATLYRSRRRFERNQTPVITPSAPPVTHRRSRRNLNQQDSSASVSTGSVSPPPAYVSPAHQPRRHRPDQLHLLTPNTTYSRKPYLMTAQIDSHSQTSSTRHEFPPPLETDI
ncbi:unnamed protein product [Adineta ricciae]|uniref:SRCR domain-containing protein n=3 Tax=Adineta ricciae TaxID=249248 RepID=A0A814DZ61_ADIRI|nr:unnamed protein product [Adineta ricciae]